MRNHDDPESITGGQFTRFLRKVIERFLFRQESVVVVRHDLESKTNKNVLPSSVIRQQVRARLGNEPGNSLAPKFDVVF